MGRLSDPPHFHKAMLSFGGGKGSLFGTAEERCLEGEKQGRVLRKRNLFFLSLVEGVLLFSVPRGGK